MVVEAHGSQHQLPGEPGEKGEGKACSLLSVERTGVVPAPEHRSHLYRGVPMSAPRILPFQIFSNSMAVVLKCFGLETPEHLLMGSVSVDICHLRNQH